MSPIILVIVCTEIMQCGCAAALKGTAAEGNNVLGLNREAARRVQKAASFTPETSQAATAYFGRSVRLLKITYLIGDLWLWRVLLFPLGAMCLLGLCAAPSPLASPDVKNRNHTLFLMMRGSSDGRADVCCKLLSAAAALSARTRGALGARLLDYLLAFPKQTHG